MTKNPKLCTAESVSEGYPDKVADRISDAILDAYLAVDPLAQVNCNALITGGKVILSGFIKSTVKPEKQLIEIARETIYAIGHSPEIIEPIGDKIEYMDLTNVEKIGRAHV